MLRPRGNPRLPLVSWLALAVVLTAAGLGSCTSPSASGHTTLQVVAAENFYGSLARQIAGPDASVTSILSNPDADPHLFQPGTDTGQAVATADVVIENGAGYDPWMDRLLAAAPRAHRFVVNIADVLHVSGADPNPHLWYDAYQMPQVISAIKAALVRADPAHKHTYRAGAASATKALGPLIDQVHQLRQSDGGDPVAYTERVPEYLLSDAGLRVLTPASFARAIEDGTDPSASDIASMQSLLLQHRVDALLYNRQATSPLTERLRQVAVANHVPVVAVTETLPAGLTFVRWQLEQVKALEKALATGVTGSG